MFAKRNKETQSGWEKTTLRSDFYRERQSATVSKIHIIVYNVRLRQRTNHCEGVIQIQ